MARTYVREERRLTALRIAEKHNGYHWRVIHQLCIEQLLLWVDEDVGDGRHGLMTNLDVFFICDFEGIRSSIEIECGCVE